MKHSVLLVLFLPFTAQALPLYANVFGYQNPSEREGGELIKDGELAYLTMYEYDCDSEVRIGEPKKYTHNLIPGGAIKKHYLFSDKPASCYRMTITDTEGRTSSLSVLFKGYDFRTPKPMECLQ